MNIHDGNITCSSSFGIPSGGIAKNSCSSGDPVAVYVSPSSVRIHFSFLMSWKTLQKRDVINKWIRSLTIRENVKLLVYEATKDHKLNTGKPTQSKQPSANQSNVTATIRYN